MMQTSMETHQADSAITICVQDARIRRRLVAIVEKMGINYVIWSSEDLLNLKFNDYIILLETGNDVGTLTNSVDHIYSE